MKTQTMIGKLFLVFCCISMALSFAFVSNASAGDENGRLEGEAEITVSHDGALIDIDIEHESFEIYGLAECKAVENANQIKVSCKGEGLPVKWFIIFPIQVDVDNALPVELEKCKVKVYDKHGNCVLKHGEGQATLAANYKDALLWFDSANISLTCFFRDDKD